MPPAHAERAPGCPQPRRGRIDEQVSRGHGGEKAGVAGACGEAMEAFRVAAGCVGDVAAVARGGLVDAVGAVVGAHGLAQPAVAGTVRLFREPAGTVSLFVLYLPGGGVKVAGAGAGLNILLQLMVVALLFAKAFPMRRRWKNGLMLLIAPVLAVLINTMRIVLLAWINASGLPQKQWWVEFLHDFWGGLVFAGVAMQLFAQGFLKNGRSLPLQLI